MSEEEKEEISKKKENSKFSKEIFIRNLNFNTTEEKLKEFFIQFIPENSIEFCLIVKDKETNNSKGTAFIKLKEKSYNKIMNLYNESNKKNFSNLKELNPFELEGRNLKLFDVKSKEEIKNLSKDKNKKETKRNKEYLYYGLSKESIKNCDLINEINDIDNNKREKLIQIKKNNYYQNPNYHVSLTRISLRNFDKNINENDIKNLLVNSLNKNKEIVKKYKNIKKIKQIKILKDDEGKSKCVSFVECFNFELAKFIIDKLSGYKFNDKNNKGLIIDFSLDDFRKKNIREKKIERIKEYKKQKKKEKKEKYKQFKKENNNNNVSVKDCNDINKLIEMYQLTLSRGKRQRIKKKLKSLGYEKAIPPLQTKINNSVEKNISINENDYEQIKIENNKTNLNKKLKDKIKKEKKEILGKKTQRNYLNENQFVLEDEDKKFKKNLKKEKKEIQIAKKEINDKKFNKNQEEEYSEEEDDIKMKDYYDKIMKKLNKTKNKKKNK